MSCEFTERLYLSVMPCVGVIRLSAREVGHRRCVGVTYRVAAHGCAFCSPFLALLTFASPFSFLSHPFFLPPPSHPPSLASFPRFLPSLPSLPSPLLPSPHPQLLDIDPQDQAEEDGGHMDLDAQRKGKCAVIKTSTRQVPCGM